MAAVRVPLPFRVPARASAPTVSLPPMASAAPAATVTLATSARRLALPSVRVPLTTSTVLASAVPRTVVLPLELSAPGPNASEAKAPLLST